MAKKAKQPKLPSREMATDLTKYRRSTYYLKRETQAALKIMAIRRDMKLTTLVRNILEEYVTKHSKD